MIPRTNSMWRGAAWLMAMVGAMLVPSRAPGQDGAGTANPAGASRLSAAAQRMVQAQRLTAAHFEYAAAMLEAAARLDPTDARYPRLLLEAQTALMGQKPTEAQVDAALATAAAYRKLAPEDRGIQVQVIDWHLARMQTLDAKLRYLKGLLDNTDIHPEIRSAVAVRGSDLLLERSRSEAVAGLTEALRLNPLNTEAIARRLALLDRDAGPTARAGAYLAMLKANPANAEFLYALATECAAAGLRDEAAYWLEKTVAAAARPGQMLPVDLRLMYAAELLMVGRPQATAILEDMVKADSEAYEALLLRWLVEKRKEDAKPAEKTLAQARNALVNRVQKARAGFDKTATTQPVTDKSLELPDLGGDAASVGGLPEGQRKQYLAAVQELIWFELYFNKRLAEAERILKSMGALLPESETFHARVAGWALLLGGKNDEAKAKLSGIAEKDPWAALAMLKLAAAANDDNGRSAALRQVSAWGFGATGAILTDALRDLNLTLQPTADAAAIKERLASFPSDLLKILETPQSFYALRVEPIKTRHQYGEAMMVRVTIQNNGQHDLLIGRDGIVKPDLWFDATAPQQAGGFYFDRIVQTGVLKPKEAITQLVRVDQAGLAGLLEASPVPVYTVNLAVRTNPYAIAVERQQIIGSAPGGFSSPMTKPMERCGFPVRDLSAFAPLRDTLRSGSRAEKIQVLDVLRAFVRAFSTPPEQADENTRTTFKTTSAALLDDIRKATADTDAAVRAWARYYHAIVSDDATRARLVMQLTGEEDWLTRLLGVDALRSLPVDKARALARPMAGVESDPVIRRLVGAIADLAEMPAATQPATQPSGDAPGIVPSAIAPPQAMAGR